jgi:hypothetical protein
MAQVQITSWRELPSFVAARNGDDAVKVQLPRRFQEAIDEAAMRSGAMASDAYIDGWVRGEWVEVAGSATSAADTVAAELEAVWSTEAIAVYLDACGPAGSEDLA